MDATDPGPRIFVEEMPEFPGGENELHRIEVIGPVDPLLDNEAIRIVNLLPRFKPGKQNGVAVPVWFTIPVVFRIK